MQHLPALVLPAGGASTSCTRLPCCSAKRRSGATSSTTCTCEQRLGLLRVAALLTAQPFSHPRLSQSSMQGQRPLASQRLRAATPHTQTLAQVQASRGGGQAARLRAGAAPEGRGAAEWRQPRQGQEGGARGGVSWRLGTAAWLAALAAPLFLYPLVPFCCYRWFLSFSATYQPTMQAQAINTDRRVAQTSGWHGSE